MNVYVFLSFVALILYVEAGIYVLFSLPSSRAKYLFVALSIAFAFHSMFYLLAPFFSEVSSVYLLDKIASIGWLLFPVLIVELFFTLSRSRGIFLRKVINFILIPAALLFLFRYWHDAATVKEFYSHNGVWYYKVDVGNIWFAGFVIYLFSSVVTSLIILTEWKRRKNSRRERLKVNVLLISLLLFVLASIVSNLVYPATGNTSLAALSYFNALPLGVGFFYTLVHLRQKPFSPEVISNLISSRIREFVFYLDQNGKIYAANRFSLENLRYNSYELQRLRPHKLFTDYHQVESFIEHARENQVSPEFTMNVITKQGTEIPVMLTVVKIEDRYQTLLGMVLIGVDYRQKIKLQQEITERMRNEKILSNIRQELEVTVEKRTHELFEANERLKKEILERRRAEQQIKDDLGEKVVLVQEIHHRVKNNIQIIISLINMLGNHRDMTPEASDTLRGISERVRNISSIHEMFYSSENLSSINFSQFLKNTTEQIYRQARIRRNVIFRLNVGEEYLGIDQAIPAGIIFYELLGNALRHAFPSDNPGASLSPFFTVSIECFQQQNEFTLIVNDNGVGLSEEINIATARSTGFQLINVLVKQHLKGKIIAQNSFGTLFILKFTV